MRVRSLLLTGLILASVSPMRAAAQDGASASCRDDFHRMLRISLETYRAHVYGLSHPEDARTMALRFDAEGRRWYKATPDVWRATDGSQELDNARMADRQVPFSAEGSVKGYLETKGVLASDLATHIGEAAFALECELRAACDLVRASAAAASVTTVAVQPGGCVSSRHRTLSSCIYAGSTGDEAVRLPTETECDGLVRDLVAHELSVTQAAIHYDASYRTLLQLAGNLDRALRELRFPLFGNLRRFVDLVSTFHRLPCFVASCTAGPPPSP